jgi:hypothetical protein
MMKFLIKTVTGKSASRPLVPSAGQNLDLDHDATALRLWRCRSLPLAVEAVLLVPELCTANKQHRLGCNSDEAFGYAAKHQTLEAPTPVGSDHDEIGRPLF